MEKKIIKCEHCGEEIGRLVKINYPQDSFLWDKIDFDVEEYSNFGGRISDGFLCNDDYERYLESLNLDLSEEFEDYQGMTMAACYEDE